MNYFAICICHDCWDQWNQHYTDDNGDWPESDVVCPDCESQNIEFTQVEEI